MKLLSVFLVVFVALTVVNGKRPESYRRSDFVIDEGDYYEYLEDRSAGLRSGTNNDEVEHHYHHIPSGHHGPNHHPVRYPKCYLEKIDYNPATEEIGELIAAACRFIINAAVEA